MASITITYLGDIKTEITHLQSGTKIITAPPADDHGKGESFSPTDLLIASLASCILSVMGIKARASNIDIDNTTCAVTKVMAAGPRRVSEIIITFKFPKSYTEKEQKILEHTALTCPVYYSLSKDLKKTIDFGWTLQAVKE